MIMKYIKISIIVNIAINAHSWFTMLVYLTFLNQFFFLNMWDVI
jgi:hypothetical protein